ncbi:hypothetical protein V8E54_006240 [Elaphomyces granulatus]
MSSDLDHERAGLEEEILEPPRGKREKADPPASACMANIDDRLIKGANSEESTTTTSPSILVMEGNREKAGRDESTITTLPGILLMEMREQERDFQSDRVEIIRRLPAWLRLTGQGGEHDGR